MSSFAEFISVKPTRRTCRPVETLIVAGGERRSMHRRQRAGQQPTQGSHAGRWGVSEPRTRRESRLPAASVRVIDRGRPRFREANAARETLAAAAAGRGGDYSHHSSGKRAGAEHPSHKRWLSRTRGGSCRLSSQPTQTARWHDAVSREFFRSSCSCAQLAWSEFFTRGVMRDAAVHMAGMRA